MEFAVEELTTVYVVMLPLVLVIALAEGIWLSRSRPEGYDWKAWACSLADVAGRRALLSIPYTLTAPYLAWAWDHRLFTQPLDSIGSFLLLFVGLEFFYYWYHRSSHTMRWFWASHSVHHSPNQLTLASAYRLGWFSRMTGATVFFVPLVLLGFTPTVVLTALLLNLLYQFWLHADWIPRLGWLEGIFNTPSNHRVHHARNPEYLDANLWRCAGDVRPPVRHLHRRARRRAVRLRHRHARRVLAQSVRAELRAVGRPLQGPALGALAARGLDVPVRPAGLASDGAGLTTAEIRRRAGLVRAIGRLSRS